MVAQKQTFDLILEKGINQKVDSNIVDGPILSTLENGVFNKQGLIEKRKGYSKLSDTAISGSTTKTLSSGSTLIDFNDELLLLGNSELNSYVSGSSRWTYVGKAHNIGIKTSTIDNIENSRLMDSCYLSGVSVFVWTNIDTDAVTATAVDASTDRVLKRQTLVSSSFPYYRVAKTVPRGKFIDCWTNFTSSTVGGITNHIWKVWSYDTSNLSGAFVSGSAILSSSNHVLDVVKWDDTQSIYATNVKNPDDVSTKLLQVGLFNPDLQGNFSNTNGQEVITSIAIIPESGSGKVYVGYSTVSSYNGQNGLKLSVFSIPDMTASLSQSLISDDTPAYINRCTGLRISPHRLCFWVDNGNTVLHQNNWVSFAETDATGSFYMTGSSTTLIRSVGLAAKAFTHNDRHFIPIVYEDTTQPTYFLADSSGSICGRFLIGESAGHHTLPHLPSVSQKDDNTYQYIIGKKNRLTNSDQYSEIKAAKCELSFIEDKTDYSVVSDACYFCNGIPMFLDKNNLVEHGFNVYPANITIENGSTGGLTSGSYAWKVVYRWEDYAGQTHRSSPSVAVTRTVGTSNSASLSIPTLRLTQKSNVFVDVFRTEVNPTSDSIYYYTTSSVNIPTTDSITIYDSNADTTIASNEQLYTTGEELENICPPFYRFIVKVKDRLVISGLSDTKEYWVSKPIITGEPVEFSDGFVYTSPDDITGLAELDGKLIIFAKSRIFYVDGNFPDSTGQNEALSTITTIPSETGCNNANSIMSISKGVTFQSDDGRIWLLNRGLGVEGIGQEVEDELVGNRITSVCIVQNSQEIRFSLDTGKTLTWNYLFNAWSIFTGIGATSSIVHKNEYYYVSNSGCYKEQNSLNTDNGSPYSLKISTGWLKLGSLQNFKRIYAINVLGKYKSPHVLTASIAYDFESNDTEHHYFDTAAMLPQTGSSGLIENVYTFRIRLPKCPQSQAYKVTVKDTNASGSAYGLNGLSFEYSMNNIGKYGTDKSR